MNDSLKSDFFKEETFINNIKINQLNYVSDVNTNVETEENLISSNYFLYKLISYTSFGLYHLLIIFI